MSRFIVRCFTLSLDGYGAGPGQDLQNPLGVRGVENMQWMFPTRSFGATHGGGDGETGVDNGFVERSFANVGAWIMGRNMFGPVRGPWPDESWRGWWGEEPVYHCPVFVLTHHARPVLRMQGGTDFHFVTGGIEEAAARAREAAGDKDVRVGGGAATVRQFLQARMLDEVHVAVRPVLLGRGEPLFQELDLAALGYECGEPVAGERATHYVLRKND